MSVVSLYARAVFLKNEIGVTFCVTPISFLFLLQVFVLSLLNDELFVQFAFRSGYCYEIRSLSVVCKRQLQRFGVYFPLFDQAIYGVENCNALNIIIASDIQYLICRIWIKPYRPFQKFNRQNAIRSRVSRNGIFQCSYRTDSCRSINHGVAIC